MSEVQKKMVINIQFLMLKRFMNVPNYIKSLSHTSYFKVH